MESSSTSIRNEDKHKPRNKSHHDNNYHYISNTIDVSDAVDDSHSALNHSNNIDQTMSLFRPSTWLRPFDRTDAKTAKGHDRNDVINKNAVPERDIPHMHTFDYPPMNTVNMRHRTPQQRHHFQREASDSSTSSSHFSNSPRFIPPSLPLDDADAAAGTNLPLQQTTDMKPSETDSFVSQDDIESNSSSSPSPILVLGFDTSHLSRKSQFLVCASGVFTFTLGYGFLQELISVHLCFRKMGLFLSMCQFSGYTFWSFLLRTHVDKKRSKLYGDKNNATHNRQSSAKSDIPMEFYLGLSLLRALDLAMTNMAMQYINYPAKTLMKSSRVVFTMLFGALVARKKYRRHDYLVVILMATGLSIFMHADANSSAVFQPIGVVMLTTSLLCDGAITNLSESLMNKYDVGQDEFIFKLYSISLIALTAAAAVKGELREGIRFLTTQGTLEEMDSGLEPTWSILRKILIMTLFSTLGFFGSSCSAAITKNFGALTMSITSTARKATTLFLSFALFPNECTLGHVAGIILFLSSLLVKSLKAGGSKTLSKKSSAMSQGEMSDSETSGYPIRRLDSSYMIV